ncbi:hypothetical protein GO730_35930 [Spirosoma sp. HMF3257]|uniref:Ig-like domain-containing protein n=1 Tax=Spirosoma telluris TaxID=2183553 RepID=A0A327NRW4_9BACT|nr:hypothetical protein [Spirosoma telluris]RAI78131.1 hypothetical protein HMF3257_35850 [Spirosoma telluris]
MQELWKIRWPFILALWMSLLVTPVEGAFFINCQGVILLTNRSSAQPGWSEIAQKRNPTHKHLLPSGSQMTSRNRCLTMNELLSGNSNPKLWFEGQLSLPTSERESLADSIALLSRDSYCLGGNPELTVTGTNVRWYADADKKRLLYLGNTYHSPPIDQTTTFYLTQTLSGVETSPIAITIEIVEAFLHNMIIIPASCEKNDGVISVTATGGTARNPLYYSLNKGPAQRTPVFTNLAPGTYLLMDSVAAGCWGTSEVVVPAPPSPTISSILPLDPHCGQTDGAITILAFGGSGSLLYSLNGVDFKTDNQFTSLAGGTYTVTVKDRDQCTASISVSLEKSVNLTINQVEVITTTCGKTNGLITIHSEAGNGRITYSIDSLRYQFANTFDSLAAGTYLVSVQDETGCRAAQQVAVGPSDGPTINHILALPPTCGMADGQISLSATSLRALSYGLNGMAYQADSSFRQLPLGTYTVTVRDDRGCLVERSIMLGEPCVNTIYMPDSFTPNGDGINDGWVVFFPMTSLQFTDLIIYNRWGTVVFHRGAEEIKNGAILWDGYEQGVVIEGIYTYQLRVQFPTGQNQVYQGKVALLR